MSEANLQIVRNGFEMFLAGDLPGFLDLMADDVQWDHRGPEGAPYNRMFRGRSGVAEFFNILAVTCDREQFEVNEYFASGDRVLALGHCSFVVRATGRQWGSDFAMAFTLRDGRVSDWRGIYDKTAEAAAFRA